MLRPSIYDATLFDDLFDFPDFDKLEHQINKKLYGHHAKDLMKTDIKDHNDSYEMIIDLPGFKKDEINASLENGYLTIRAARGLDKDETDKESGNYIRRERYAGSCQRSFYVGTGITQDQIHGEFKHGILRLTIPKPATATIEKKNNYISIEG